MPIDLSLQSPSTFFEDTPRAALTSLKSIRAGPSKHRNNNKSRHISFEASGPEYQHSSHDETRRDNRDRDSSKHESSRKRGGCGVDVSSWEWDNEHRHRTEQADACSLNKKIKEDNCNLNVLDMLSQQLKATAVSDESHGGVGAAGTDDALYIIKNMSNVDDCLKLKQQRREERQKRRAELQREGLTAVDVPIPRNDLFTSEFHKEREGKEMELKLQRREQKGLELKHKEQQLASKMARARAAAPPPPAIPAKRSSSPSPPKLTSRKVLPSIKPEVSTPNIQVPDIFKLPEQITSRKYPVSSKEMVFTLPPPVTGPHTVSFLDTQPSFMSVSLGGGGGVDNSAIFSHMQQTSMSSSAVMASTILSTSQLKTSKTPTVKQLTKPTAMAVEYVDKQQMWAFQVEAKRVKARKESEEREVGALRLVPDVKQAQESWLKLKKAESRKSGGVWPPKREQQQDELHVELQRSDLPRHVGEEKSGEGAGSAEEEEEEEEEEGLGAMSTTHHQTSTSQSHPPRTASSSSSSSLELELELELELGNDDDVSRDTDVKVEQREHRQDTAVKNMITADNMAILMHGLTKHQPTSTTTTTTTITSTDYHTRARTSSTALMDTTGMVEGEDGFENDEYDLHFSGGIMNNSSVLGGTTYASVVDNKQNTGTSALNSLVQNESTIGNMNNNTAASEFGYDEQFFATRSLVKAGASLVLLDGAVIGGFAYEHPLQTNKNDSVYTTPASPLKRVVGEEEVPYDTDRFGENTERSAYDTPKGIFGRENPPTSVRGGAYRWDSDDEEEEEEDVHAAGGRVVLTGREGMCTGRSGGAGGGMVDTARSDCSDYDGDWEFTGLPSNNNRTARGSEGTWRRKVPPS